MSFESELVSIFERVKTDVIDAFNRHQAPPKPDIPGTLTNVGATETVNQTPTPEVGAPAVANTEPTVTNETDKPVDPNAHVAPPSGQVIDVSKLEGEATTVAEDVATGVKSVEADVSTADKILNDLKAAGPEVLAAIKAGLKDL